jgi:uncharacterized RDD family membrane protein YckC
MSSARVGYLFSCLFLLGSLCRGLPQEPAQTLERTAAEDAAKATVVEESTNQPATRAPAVVRGKGSRARSHRGGPEPRVAICSDLLLRENETASDVVVIGGVARIEGKITQNLVVVLGEAKLGPKAEVRKDLVVMGGGLEADPEAKIGSIPFLHGGTGWWRWLVQWMNSGLMQGRLLPYQHAWSWWIAGGALLAYAILGVLFPRQVHAVVGTLGERPGHAWLMGIFAAMLLAPLLVLLAVSVIGILVIPVAVGGFVLSFVFGKVAVCRYAGQQFGSQFGSQFLQQPLPALLTGGLLLCALYTVPVLGVLVWFAAAPLALGAVMLTFFKGKARATDRSAVSVPDVPVGATTGELLPRAGFWIRLLATTLDLLLVGMAAAFLHRGFHWFLLLWTLYHLTFWSWRGMTVGGMVLGLRVIRIDGQPMNIAVALVRLFASLFSLVPCGLGFVWAAWSPDKQSWHDKMAGTLVVKSRGPSHQWATA